MENKIKQAIELKGYLGKESPNLFGGYQKRFFQIIKGDIESGEGYILTYSDEEGKQVKGAINLLEISEVISLNKKEFYFNFGERKFKLKADNESIKNKWIEALNILRKDQLNNYSTENYTSNSNDIKTKTWKLKNQKKEIVDTLQGSGVTVSKETNFSDKLLDLKGIRKLLKAIPSNGLKTRIKYGFMTKKSKYNSIISQKRWFFIISSRPLSTKDQLSDEDTYNDSYLPPSLSFDTLYYYSAEDDHDTSAAKGELSMKDCSRIETKESDKEFYIIIDMNDRIFEFCCNVCWERDQWYEVLITSSKTAKDISTSITGKPRNMIRIVEIYKQEESRVDKIIDEEINSISKEFNEIKDGQLLSLLVTKLDNKLTQTLDGLQLYVPKQMELIKIYSQKFDNFILLKIQNYWNTFNDNINVS